MSGTLQYVAVLFFNQIRHTLAEIQYDKKQNRKLRNDEVMASMHLLKKLTSLKRELASHPDRGSVGQLVQNLVHGFHILLATTVLILHTLHPIYLRHKYTSL